MSHFPPVMDDDDSVDNYWNPSFNNLENDGDLGRDRILEIIMCLVHFMQDKLTNLSRDNRALNSVRFKNLSYLNNFLFKMTILVLQAKFGFFHPAPRNLPRRSMLSDVIERHSLLLMNRSNSLLFNPLLAGNLNEESVHSMFNRHLGSIFKIEGGNKETEVENIAALVKTIGESLMLSESFRTERSQVVTQESERKKENNASIQIPSSSSQAQAQELALHKNKSRVTVATQTPPLPPPSSSISSSSPVQGSVEECTNDCDVHSSQASLHEGQRPSSAQNESNSKPDEGSGSEEEDSTHTVHSESEQKKENGTPARSTYASAVRARQECLLPSVVADIKERYAQLRKLAKKQLDEYIQTKAEMQKLEKRMVDQPDQLWSDDDDDIFGRYDLSRAGASIPQLHVDKKTNMAATSATDSSAKRSAQRDEKNAESEFSGNDEKECKVCSQKHEYGRCPLLKNKTCYNCGVIGHIKMMCRETRSCDSD